ncbi:MAG TPA: undecaprenyl-diphosphate phosphatase [Cyclobacteriaceae bacterium]|nr:undecaprenyl-diphosphate phosphatase [Cyclobacteriaceae bacterium]
MSLLQSILLAIIEGLTEFLPVSSTGHMIIASSVMGIEANSFVKLFTVVIQLGAILSVVVLYWRKFFQTFNFYWKIGVAFIPSLIAGLFLKKYIDALLERVDVVGFTLLLGGVFFLFMDRIFKQNEETDQSVSYSQAFKIGSFQLLSLVPGVSRSAATIIGGMTQKLTRKNAAEFSFFLAIPTMLGAAVLTLWNYYSDGMSLSSTEINLLVIGNIVAFLVAMVAIKSFIQFLTNHGFKLFGYYRIIVGTIILLLYYFGTGLSIL